MRRLLLPLAALTFAPMTLAGCKLIDQTTFAPAAETPSAADIAALPPIESRAALLTIRYATAAPDYAASLREAVRLAEARRPGTVYDVVAVVPVSQDPALVDRNLAQTRADAAGVMRSMMALGIPDSRIRLGARTDPAITVREIRVYVR